MNADAFAEVARIAREQITQAHEDGYRLALGMAIRSLDEMGPRIRAADPEHAESVVFWLTAIAESWRQVSAEFHMDTPSCSAPAATHPATPAATAPK